MKIVCLGGGPAGLYFAISMKLRDPAHEITILERNKADDTFGWGVVLSDETLSNLARNDQKSADMIHAHFAYWDDIALIHQGQRLVSSGHGFCGIGRKKMLLLLQERARELTCFMLPIRWRPHTAMFSFLAAKTNKPKNKKKKQSKGI